jgi:hypothetical protein
MDMMVKRAVLGAMMSLAALGIYIAIDNLPVLTGCGYYGQCGASVVAD